MLSFMTYLISPVLRSLRRPRGIFAMCSVTMHLTLKSVLYAPLCEEMLAYRLHPTRKSVVPINMTASLTAIVTVISFRTRRSMTL